MLNKQDQYHSNFVIRPLFVFIYSFCSNVMSEGWKMGFKARSVLLGSFTWRIAAAVKPPAPDPARTPPSLPGDASRSPVAGVALPLARGSAFLAVGKSRRTINSQAVCGLGLKRSPSSHMPQFYDPLPRIFDPPRMRASKHRLSQHHNHQNICSPNIWNQTQLVLAEKDNPRLAAFSPDFRCERK